MMLGVPFLHLQNAPDPGRHPLHPSVVMLPEGDLVCHRGSYYDYRAADGGSQIRLWVPPGGKAVRGLIVSGHGGGSGDSRPFVRDENLRALADRFGFGLVGLHRFPGNQASTTGVRTLAHALRAFSELGPNKELATAPWAVFGSSNGGSTAYGFAAGAPERTICFVSNVMTRFTPAFAGSPAARVPGVFVIGQYDRLMGGESSVAPFRAEFAQAREEKALWSLVVEAKGHEDGSAFSLFTALLESVVEKRLPAKIGGPLKDISGEGFYGQLDPREGHAPGLSRDESLKSSWLPDESFARVWQGASTRNSRLRIAPSNVQQVVNPNVNPWTMFSIGAPVVQPGKKIEIAADTAFLGSWKEIEFYAGSKLVGAVKQGSKAAITYQTKASDRVLTFTGHARLADGTAAASAPISFLIRSGSANFPEPEWGEPIPKFGEPEGSLASKGVQPPQREDGVLVSYGLSADEEMGFGQADGISAFWAKHGDRHSRISLNCVDNAREGSEFSVVTTADARLSVRAAHSTRGLYLLFEVMDNEFSPPSPEPSRFAEQDAIDLMIDSHSSAWINDPQNLRWATNLDWGIWLTTKQLQTALGGPGTPDSIKVNEAEPFELVFDRLLNRAEVQKRRGIVVRNTILDPMRRAVELFLPWSEVGAQGGLKGEPNPGTRMAFCPTYNDMDGGGPRKTLAWIGNKTPWNFSASQPGSPRGWGDIEIGPMLSAAAPK